MSHVHFVRRSKLFHFHFQINKTDKIDIDTYFRWLVEIIQIHWFFPSNILLHHYKTYRIIQITYFHENNNKMHLKATTKKMFWFVVSKKIYHRTRFTIWDQNTNVLLIGAKNREMFLFFIHLKCVWAAFLGRCRNSTWNTLKYRTQFKFCIVSELSRFTLIFYYWFTLFVVCISLLSVSHSIEY